jgi:hypothetical protein
MNYELEHHLKDEERKAESDCVLPRSQAEALKEHLCFSMVLDNEEIHTYVRIVGQEMRHLVLACVSII